MASAKLYAEHNFESRGLVHIVNVVSAKKWRWNKQALDHGVNVFVRFFPDAPFSRNLWCVREIGAGYAQETSGIPASACFRHRPHGFVCNAEGCQLSHGLPTSNAAG